MEEDYGITLQFLEETLKFPVEKFFVKPGSALGDNYACALLSVAVWKKSPGPRDVNPVNLMVKCYPTNPVRQEFLESSNIFKIEVGTYEEVIPELYKFQEEMKVDKIVKPPFAPYVAAQNLDPEVRKALGRPLNPTDSYIIMPDLRTPENGGYRLRDRFLGFDLAHYSLVIEAQARLHALGWAYKVKRGIKTLIEKFSFQAVSDSQMEGFKAVVPVVGGVCEMSKTTFANDPRIVEAISFLQERFVKIFQLYWDVDLGADLSNTTRDNVIRRPVPVNNKEEQWTTLLHGDAWSNNMLFRYDEKTGRPVEVVFIDLQMSREGDPFCDMQYSLYCSTSKDLRDKHLTSMLHVYYDTFTQVCNRLGVPPFPGWSWEEFLRRFRRTKIIGANSATMGLPIMLKNPDEVVDMDKMKLESNGDESIVEFFKVMTSSNPNSVNPILEKRLRGMLEDMIEDDIL